MTDKHVAPLNILINTLQGFYFPEFSSNFLEGTKNGLSLYLGLVQNTKDNDWAQPTGAAEYEIKLSEKEDDNVVNKEKTRKPDKIGVEFRVS